MALFNTELNSKVKIFSQLYVGLKPAWQEGHPKLGFATPFEKGAAFEKRKQTVDQWATVSAYDYTTKQYKRSGPETTVIENTLRDGFQITDDIKRVYWGGGNVVWRVLDPYGFELEIPSANLMAIIQVSGIEEGGKIPGKCCWGRDGATNVLLHEKSDVYLNAIKNAEDIKKAKELHAKNRVTGNRYTLQSGDACSYLGKFRVHSLNTVMHKPGDSYRDREYDHYEVAICTPAGRNCVGELYKYDIQDDGVFDAVIVDGDDKYIHFYRKAPIIAATDGKTLSDKQIEKLVSKNQFKFAAAGKNNPIIHVARKVTSDLVFAVVPMRQQTLDAVLEKASDVATGEYSGFNQLFYTYGRLPVGFIMGADANSLWQHAGTNRATYPGKNEDFFCPTIVTEKQITAVHCDYGRSYYSGSYLKVDPFKTAPTPLKTTVVEWVKELFENGYLVEVIVAEKE